MFRLKIYEGYVTGSYVIIEDKTIDSDKMRSYD